MVARICCKDILYLHTYLYKYAYTHVYIQGHSLECCLYWQNIV